MALVAIRINSVSGTPFDEDGEELDEGWEIEDGSEVLIWADTGDLMDIENGILEVREALVGWSA